MNDNNKTANLIAQEISELFADLKIRELNELIRSKFLSHDCDDLFKQVLTKLNLSEVLIYFLNSKDASLISTTAELIHYHDYLWEENLRRIKNSLNKPTIFTFFYYLLKFQVFWNYNEKYILEIIGLLSDNHPEDLFSHSLAEFVQDMTQCDFDGKEVFSNGYIIVIGTLTTIGDEQFRNSLSQLVLDLINLKKISITVMLLLDGLMDDFPPQRKSSIFSEYPQEEIFNALKQAFTIPHFLHEDWSITEYRILKIAELGELGIRLLLRLYFVKGLRLEDNILRYFTDDLKDENLLQIIRDELVNYFNVLDADQIDYFFFFRDDMTGKALADLLKKEDILKIHNSPESNILQKLKEILRKTEDSPPYEVATLLFPIEARGIPLLLQFLRQDYWVNEAILDHFKQWGENIIPAFLEDVIFTTKYNYGDLVDNLYEIFVDALSKEKLKDLLYNKELNFIEKLNEKYTHKEFSVHNPIYFFKEFFRKLDAFDINVTYNRLSEDMKKELYDLFSEMLYEGSQNQEARRVLRILSPRRSITDFFHYFAKDMELPLMAQLESNFTNTKVELPDISLDRLFNILLDTYKFQIATRDFKYQDKTIIMERFYIKEIVDYVQEVFQNIISPTSFGTPNSWIENLTLFFEMINEVTPEVTAEVDNYISEGLAFNVGEELSYEDIYKILEEYIIASISHIIKIEDDKTIVIKQFHVSDSKEKRKEYQFGIIQ